MSNGEAAKNYETWTLKRTETYLKKVMLDLQNTINERAKVLEKAKQLKEKIEYFEKLKKDLNEAIDKKLDEEIAIPLDEIEMVNEAYKNSSPETIKEVKSEFGLVGNDLQN